MVLLEDPEVGFRSVGKVRPFVKWVGGKRSISDVLVSRFPESFDSYWEPFVGGGALFFRIHESISRASLSDSNPDLMITFAAVKENSESLVQKLEHHSMMHCKEYYYRMRGWHNLEDFVDVAARLIYLNKTCFNGLYRVNKKGEFNVPMGSSPNPDVVTRENIGLCSVALQKADLVYQEFDMIRPSGGDLVYFDPPYHPVGSTSFTSYTKSSFGVGDQERLRDFAFSLHRAGVHVILSNSDTPFIRDLYRGPVWNISTVGVPRCINSKGNGRGPVSELIISNFVQ